MSVNVVNKSTGALTKVAGNAITEASGINYSHTTSGMSATNVQDAIDESYDSLKSGLTDLTDHVDGSATTYPYADVITIPDAVPANLADCSVKVEPVQDLHGYDKPWVGGAGINKLYWNPEITLPIEQNGITITSDGNGGIYLNGTSTGPVQVISAFKTDILSGQTTLCKLASANNNGVIYAGNRPGESYTSYTYGYDTFTGDGKWRLDLYISSSGSTFNNLHLQPMVIMGSDHLTEFSPYENICPISGHTEVVVTRNGKNLLNIHGSYINRQGVSGTYTISGDSITVTASSQTSAFAGFIVPIEVGETYTLSYIASTKVRTIQIDEPISVITQSYYGTDTDSGTSFVASKPYILINFIGDTSGVTFSNIQLEKGSTPTTYKAYEGQQYTLALGDTIYGGTVDFDTGVMTVDRAIVDYADLNWTYYAPHSVFNVQRNDFKKDGTVLSSAQNAITTTFQSLTNGDITGNSTGFNDNPFFITKDTRFTDPTDFKNAMNGQKIVYELATPITIQLTPQQIQLLQGTNTLYASTGDISVTVNGVSGSIGAVQEQVNGLAEQLPDAPTTDGAYVLTVTVADGAATYSWESAT